MVATSARMCFERYLIHLGCALCLLSGWTTIGRAQDALEDSDTLSDAADNGDAIDSETDGRPDVAEFVPDDSELSRRAVRIGMLIDGTLPETVDKPEALFTLDLTRGDLDSETADQLLGAFVRVEAGDVPERVDNAQDLLVRALADWQALPPERQAELVQNHRTRADALARKKQAVSAHIKELNRTREQLAQLAAGRLPVEIDPTALVEVRLSAAPDAAGTGLEPELARAQRALAEARRAFVARPAAERAQAITVHRERQRVAAARLREEAEAKKAAEEARERQEEAAKVREAAEQAAAEQQQALEEARSARTEALRQLGEERARLLGIKEAQHRFRAELGEVEPTDEARRVRLQRFHEESEALGESHERGDDTGASADALFEGLIPILIELSDALTEALDSRHQVSEQVPRVGPDPLVKSDAPDEELRTVRALRSELSAAETELVRRAREAAWARAEALRKDLGMAVETRNTVIALVSGDQGDAITSFGSSGVRQAGIEARVMLLAVRYRFAEWPRVLRQLKEDVETSPLPLLFMILKLIVAIVVLRLWRRRADAIIDGLSEDLSARPSRIARFVGTVLWYLGRVRKPLEWLILLAIVLGLVQDLVVLPEASLVSLVASWLLGGLMAIRFVDAMAARGYLATTRQDTTSALRFRSLRLIGGTVAIIGLLLSLAHTAVGEGALYSWLWSTCWLMIIPIVYLLTRWWRDTIFQLLRRPRHKGRLVRWILAKEQSRLWFVAAITGGVYLMIDGARRRLFRRFSDFDVGKRALAYLLRREVERQSRVASSQDLVAITDDEKRKLFVPPAPEAQLTREAGDAFEALQKMIRMPAGNVVALVGERGIGKTTVVSRVTADIDPGAMISVMCPSGGLSELMLRLAERLSVPAADQTPERFERALFERISDAHPAVIVIDSAHHLVRPVIDGLIGLERVVDLARRAPITTTWILPIDLATWQHINRASGDRTLFDRVVRLEPWSEDSIGELVLERARSIGLEPKFHELALPGQPDEDADLTPEARQERAFYRILWDYSLGNPAIALHFWAQSLYRAPDGAIIVRVFDMPRIELLDGLPTTMYFVLRAVVQLDVASMDDIVACTMYQPDDVTDALRAARAQGWVEWRDDHVRVTWEWLRSVKTVLQRRHLLIT